MTDYCETPDCLRVRLLRYFRETAQERCGNCGDCAGERVRQEMTVEARKILSGVARVERKYPSGLGLTLIVRMLHGSREQRVLALGLDRLPTYGILRDMDRMRIRAYIDELLRQGYLYLTEGEFPVLRLTERAAAVLFRGESVFYTFRKRHQSEKTIPPKTPAQPESGLYEVLRRTRARLAREENVPAYIVFSNATLADMAAKRPRDMMELMEVSGVGEVKARRYGTEFLETIAAWEREKN